MGHPATYPLATVNLSRHLQLLLYRNPRTRRGGHMVNSTLIRRISQR